MLDSIRAELTKEINGSQKLRSAVCSVNFSEDDFSVPLFSSSSFYAVGSSTPFLTSRTRKRYGSYQPSHRAMKPEPIFKLNLQHEKKIILDYFLQSPLEG